MKAEGISLYGDMKDKIRKYFQAWLDADCEAAKKLFSDDITYSECYGPEYHGLSQIVQWFEDWNQRGRVLEWTIKRTIEQGQTVVAEWYFRCVYDRETDGFDGVTIADFDNEGKICRLCEFQSKADHYYPYSE